MYDVMDDRILYDRAQANTSILTNSECGTPPCQDNCVTLVSLSVLCQRFQLWKTLWDQGSSFQSYRRTALPNPDAAQGIMHHA